MAARRLGHDVDDLGLPAPQGSDLPQERQRIAEAWLEVAATAPDRHQPLRFAGLQIEQIHDHAGNTQEVPQRAERPLGDRGGRLRGDDRPVDFMQDSQALGGRGQGSGRALAPNVAAVQESGGRPDEDNEHDGARKDHEREPEARSVEAGLLSLPPEPAEDQRRQDPCGHQPTRDLAAGATRHDNAHRAHIRAHQEDRNAQEHKGRRGVQGHRPVEEDPVHLRNTVEIAEQRQQ